MKKATHRHSKHTILLLMFFRPRGLELNQLGLQVYESRLIQYQTPRTKNKKKVSLILDTSYFL